MNNDDGLGNALLARVAACNFANTVFDTNDLSTSRGGSLILLRFPEEIVQRLQREHPELQVAAIASGASELLLRFAPLPGAAQAVEGLLQTMLRDSAPRPEEPWALFTYVWALEAPEDRKEATFPQRLNRLIARCNARQFQQPTVIIPPFYSDEKRKEAGGKSDALSVVCTLDGVSPAAPGVVRKDKAVSHSVRCRRDFGVQAKQRFYEQELKDLAPERERRFAHDFSELVPPPGERRAHDIPDSLTGKMALIYLDGNGFGRKRESDGTTAAALKIFSEGVKAKRKALLHDVLAFLDTLPGMVRPGDEKTSSCLRFETLLWGGDEVMWALPAWRAWAVMGKVQEHLNGSSVWGDLTHAAGMLIAPYKAPIKDLAALVRDLGDTAKQGGGRSMNGVQIGVVTGFDLPGLDVNALRRPLFAADGSGAVPHGAFQCDGAAWGEIQRRMAAIKGPRGGLPRSALHRLHHEALAEGLFAAGKAADARRCLDDGIERIGLVHESDVSADAVATLRDGFPGAVGVAEHPLTPLHQILSLWDIAQ